MLDTFLLCRKKQAVALLWRRNANYTHYNVGTAERGIDRAELKIEGLRHYRAFKKRYSCFE